MHVGHPAALQDYSAIFTVFALMLFGSVMGLIFLFVFLARRYGLKSGSWTIARARAGSARTASALSAGTHGSMPLPAGWLTIRSQNSSAILKALHLHSPTPCSWAEGLAGMSENNLFVSAPIGGWTLVLGPALPDPSADIDKCYHLLTKLSMKLGHVEFFWRNPALNGHAWAQVECGQIIRAYAWAGETLWNQGERTAAEHELQMRSRPYGQEAARPPWSSIGFERANMEKVPLLAQRWSLDPGTVPDQFPAAGHGVIAETSHPIFD